MSIGDTLRRIGPFGPDTSRLVPGTGDEQRRARNQWRREKDAEGIRERWDEIPAERLVFERHWIEDVETGNFYWPFAGDPGFAAGVVAYYVRDGWPVMLEPANPPSRAELERRQAAKEQRRLDNDAARTARYEELRRR